MQTAQVDVLLPMNVNVSIDDNGTATYYKDGNLVVIGVGQDVWDALNDFRIEFAAKVHALANPVTVCTTSTNTGLPVWPCSPYCRIHMV